MLESLKGQVQSLVPCQIDPGENRAQWRLQEAAMTAQFQLSILSFSYFGTVFPQADALQIGWACSAGNCQALEFSEF